MAEKRNAHRVCCSLIESDPDITFSRSRQIDSDSIRAIIGLGDDLCPLLKRDVDSRGVDADIVTLSMDQGTRRELHIHVFIT
jgi:hypothetical protein